MLPTASTLMRACVVVDRRQGAPTASRRSACWRPATVGNVVPPSVDSRMLHVRRADRRRGRVRDVPRDRLRRAAGQLTAVFGAVTRNGCRRRRRSRRVHAVHAAGAGAVVTHATPGSSIVARDGRQELRPAVDARRGRQRTSPCSRSWCSRGCAQLREGARRGRRRVERAEERAGRLVRCWAAERRRGRTAPRRRSAASPSASLPVAVSVNGVPRGMVNGRRPRRRWATVLPRGAAPRSQAAPAVASEGRDLVEALRRGSSRRCAAAGPRRRRCRRRP